MDVQIPRNTNQRLETSGNAFQLVSQSSLLLQRRLKVDACTDSAKYQREIRDIRKCISIVFTLGIIIENGSVLIHRNRRADSK